MSQGMDFADALRLMREGQKVRRASWRDGFCIFTRMTTHAINPTEQIMQTNTGRGDAVIWFWKIDQQCALAKDWETA